MGLILKSNLVAKIISACVFGCAVASVVWWMTRTDGRQAVLDAAYAYPNRGGYSSLSGSGVPKDIDHKGVRILSKASGGSYCTGFTFAVCMDAAAKRGLLGDAEPYQIAQFQREFYGIPKAARKRQIAHALETLGIGYGVTADEAKAGDFVIFSRKASGHAAVFLNWVLEGDRVVGFRYRSSQVNTNGVGDFAEYFVGSGTAPETIQPHTVYFGRLK